MSKEPLANVEIDQFLKNAGTLAVRSRAIAAGRRKLLAEMSDHRP